MMKRFLFGSPKNSFAFAVISILLCWMLLSCDSSDTRNAVRSSTSGEFELQASIIAPANGSTIVIEDNEIKNVTFTSTVSGGTEPVETTWLVQGQTTSNTATGASPTIVFYEFGRHTVTLYAEDSRGLTDSDSITVNLVLPVTSLTVSITAPAEAASITMPSGSSSMLQSVSISISGGLAPYTVTYNAQGPTKSDSVVSTTNSATDAASLQITETGLHTISVTAVDALGSTFSDSIRVNVQ